MEALFASAGTLGIVCGYMIVKRLARSTCVIEKCSGCFSCESSAIELVKKQTERLDELYVMVKQIAHPEDRDPPSPVRIAVDNPTTIEGKKVYNNRGAYSSSIPPGHV